MKKFGFTIAAVIVFAGLLAFVLVNKKKPEDKTPQPEEFFTALEFIRDDARGLSVTEFFDAQNVPEAGAPTITERRVQSRVSLKRNKDGSWSVTEPGPPRADKASVDSLLYALSALMVERQVEARPKDLKKYGLDAPRLEIKVTMKDRKQHVIQIGALNELAAGYYLNIVGKKPVYLIPRDYLPEAFDSGRLVDKSLTALTYEDQLVRVDLTVNGVQVKCIKKSGEWTRELGGPEQDCNYAATGIRDALISATFDDWLPENSLPETREQMGLSPALISVIALTDKEDTIELSVGKQVMDKVFVENLRRQEIYLAPAALAASLRDLMAKPAQEQPAENGAE